MMVRRIYAFDVDGTLTPSRLKIDPEFEIFLLHFSKYEEVYLVTGSDKDKTIEQVGKEVWHAAAGCLQSCGNHIFVKGEEVYRNNWEPNEDLIELLESFLKISKWRTQTSNHIERRIGLVNFSVVGRDCTQEQRDEYGKWDDGYGERLEFAKIINKSFPELEASVGGQISIDIHPRGANKSQAKEWILKRHLANPIINFFGDKTLPGGNDYDLAKVLEGGFHKVYQVNDWKDTYRILMDLKLEDGWSPNDSIK
jgi:phosphomannomutase